MKQFLKYLGVGILSVIIFVVGIGVIKNFGGIDKDEIFIPYIQESVPKLTTWDIEEYKLLMSEQGINSATPKQWALYLNTFKKLGTLKSVGTPELEKSHVSASIKNGTTTHAIYIIPTTIVVKFFWRVIKPIFSVHLLSELVLNNRSLNANVRNCKT